MLHFDDTPKCWRSTKPFLYWRQAVVAAHVEQEARGIPCEVQRDPKTGMYHVSTYYDPTSHLPDKPGAWETVAVLDNP